MDYLDFTLEALKRITEIVSALIALKAGINALFEEREEEEERKE